MPNLRRLAALAALAAVLLAPAPSSFAMFAAPDSYSAPVFTYSGPATHPGGPPQRQNFSMTLTVSGSWYPDPSFKCPGQCESNNRFHATGVLTYWNGTTSTSVEVSLNGTAHSNWAGVNKSNPCTRISTSIDITTPAHDKIHLKTTGTSCEKFRLGRWTGENTLSGTYTIMSGEGFFSEASGTGTISGSGYPRLQVWSVAASGTITCVPKR